MGNRRMGLGRLEALLEAVDRDLDLTNTTLTNPTIVDAVSIDCAGALVVDGASTFSGGITSKFLDFATGNMANLTVTPITPDDTAVDLAAATANTANILAVTLIASALNTTAFTADAAGSIYLPICTKDTHTAIQLLGDMDAANALTFFARGAAGEADAEFAKQFIYGGGSAGGVITAGTTANPTSVTLIYTPGATATNFLSVGSVIHFYAHKDNEWLVKVVANPEGTGITGAFTVG